MAAGVFSSCASEPPQLGEVKDELVALVEASYGISGIFFGDGLEAYARGGKFDKEHHLYDGNDSEYASYEYVTEDCGYLFTEKIKTDAEKVYAAAKEAVAKCTNDSMTKEQKLRAAFDYLKNNYIEGIRRNDYREMDWPVVYGKDLLIDGKGDCFSYGAAFAYMAKIIGCSDCYACNSGGHGWAEVEGKIYDPEWSRHSSNYSYFGMSYDEPCDVGYKGAIGSASWMHVAV